MWFTDYDGAIGQITAGGEVLEHSSEPLPLDPLRATPQPAGIAAGPDGALWYTDGTHARIGRLAPDGTVEEFAVPVHSPPYASGAGRPFPEGIVAGPEGTCMYFTDPGDDSIGRVTMSGEVSEYPIPSLAPVGPHDITVAGGQLVFDELDAAALGTVDPTASPGQASLATPPTLATVAASLRRQLSSASALAKAALQRPTHGFVVPFSPPEAGSATITWTADAPPARHARSRASTPTRVATGKATFDLAGAGFITVKVTAAGRRLFRRAARRSPLPLTAAVTFSGYWSGPIEVSARQRVRP